MPPPQGPGRLCSYAGSLVQRLNAAGFSVAGQDAQGAGRSQGLMCHCNSFDEYVDDTLDFARCGAARVGGPHIGFNAAV